jgi:hypothetical protein
MTKAKGNRMQIELASRTEDQRLLAVVLDLRHRTAGLPTHRRTQHLAEFYDYKTMVGDD